MLKTLDRYQKCSYNAPEAVVSSKETQKSYDEYLKLKARVEFLQHSQRNLLGEELGQLNTNELEQLEKQLEMSLKQIRSTKTQLMLDQLCDLQRKEQILQEANRALKRKLEEASSEDPLRLSWENGSGGGPSAPYDHQPARSEGFFQPLPCYPSLQIGYNPVCIDQLSNGATEPSGNGYVLPAWM